MANRTRADLQTALTTFINSTTPSGGTPRKVYFQPPESVKLSYPCIIYDLDGMYSKYGDNRPYLIGRRYSIIFITKDPDDVLIDNIMKEFSMITFNSTYVADNLYHYVYSLYF